MNLIGKHSPFFHLWDHQNQIELNIELLEIVLIPARNKVNEGYESFYKFR